MALTEECCETKSKRVVGVNVDEGGLGLGFVKFTRGLGRKRIVISGINIEESLPESAVKTPLKRQCSGTMILRFEQSQIPESPVETPLKRQRSGTIVPEGCKSQLESLPQDLLIRVFCCVDHDDLDRLFLVSKSIRDAALTAKQWHFAFSTPKKTLAFRNPIDFNPKDCFDDIEPPNAPIQRKTNHESWTMAKRKALSGIAMALFT